MSDPRDQLPLFEEEMLPPPWHYCDLCGARCECPAELDTDNQPIIGTCQHLCEEVDF